MLISLQVIPAPQELPERAGVVLRPDAEGTEGPCDLCGGTGKLFRRQVPCQKCGGTGTGRWVRAMRWRADSDEVAELERVRDWARQHQPTRWDTTVQLCEVGGGLTNTGGAQIVAGLDGQPLPSVWGRATMDGPHAVFWVHAALVVSYGHHRGDGSGTVSLVGVDRAQPYHLGVVRQLLWEWTDGEDPVQVADTDLRFPVAAVAAARDKARTYHCRSAYYAAGRYAAGPSGALRGAGAAFGGLPSPLKGPGIGYDPVL